MSGEPFAIGAHRPVYLWAGPGTVRMNRLKFMGASVDEVVHHEAHDALGARRMAREAAFNWAYLMYDWGFPPETEQEDWDDFCRAVTVYHDAGLRVFGYVQLSNCAFQGSYRDKHWYAVDPRGRPFPYYTGRYMTCWRHPEWLEHLRDMIRGVVEAGADGVFFDNPWHGCQPMALAGAWLGPAGCYCRHCRAAFHEDSDLDIPPFVDPERHEASRVYLRWRAGQVTEVLAGLAGYARSLAPHIVVSANDFDAVMRPSYLVFGIDLPALAAVQDVVMIEDYSLPRCDDRVLINNALTLRAARALIGDTPLSTNPYDQGIGFDGVYSPRRIQQGLAEAVACGASMVVKGTEYVEDGTFTLLTAAPFGPQREAVGGLHRWLADHVDMYRGRTEGAPVGLLYPGDNLWISWSRLAPLYFAAGQTLTAAGTPWRVVVAGDDLVGLEYLLRLGDPPAGPYPPGLRIVAVADLPGWEIPPPSFLARRPAVRAPISRVLGWLFQSYFRYRWARRLADNLGLVHVFWQTPYFRLPPPSKQATLLAALGERPCPRVSAAAPVLAELWRQGDRWQLHLVSYAEDPQTVVIDFGQPVQGRALAPDALADTGAFSGDRFNTIIDVYLVLEYVTVRQSSG